MLAAALAASLPGAAAAVEPLLAEGSALEPNGRLEAGGEEGEGHLGGGLALSADGTTALVGAPGDGGLVGAAWVFTLGDAGWAQQGPKLTVPEEPEEEAGLCIDEPGECGIGASVALSADGNVALIGAPRQHAEGGAAWVFTRSGSTWTLREQLTAGAEERGAGRFGGSVALSADGETALIGAPRDASGRGAAWVFRRTEGGFVHDGAKLVGLTEQGAGFFGRSVALSADGLEALVGAPGDAGHTGAAWAFFRSDSGWGRVGARLTGATEIGPGRFGSSVSLAADGRTALIGGRTDAAGAGAAWAFTKEESGWSQQGPKLSPSDESGAGEFGFSTALSANGGLALIGGPRDNGPFGAAWTFQRDGGVWSQGGGKLVPPEAGAHSSFGSKVALAANQGAALVGAPHDEGNAGIAWSFLGTPLPPPAIEAIGPASGPPSGGTAVTITGSGFLPGATVDIGGAASEVEVLSEDEIRALTPAHPAGIVPVVVSDLYGTSGDGPGFEYLATPAPQVPPHGTATPLVGVLASISAPLEAPKLGVAGNLLPVSGTVRVKLPGAPDFVLVGTTIHVPFGTIVDANLGKVTVTTATATGGTQAQTFYDGEFKLTQSAGGTVQATLLGGSFAGCPARRHKVKHGVAGAHAAKRKPGRKLWAEGHGKYSTKGNYATGAALGTRWVTEDLCGGTLIRVLLHRVLVTNLVTHRHFTVRAGHSYFAKAP